MNSKHDHIAKLVAAATAALLTLFSYDGDAAGRRTTLQETLNGSQSISGYHNISRIDSQTLQARSPSSAPATSSLSYGYDPTGNGTARAGDLRPVTAQTQGFDPPDPFDSDADAATPSSAADANGNTTNSAGKTYEYDPENRLIRVNGGRRQ